MKYLVDTQILLWLAWNEREKLSEQAINLLEEPHNELYFSLASLWEIEIKANLNKPGFEIDVVELEQGLIDVGFKMLPISLRHIVKLRELPPIHRDPFDRLLLAQAETEQLFFLSADRIMAQYQKHFVIPAHR